MNTTRFVVKSLTPILPFLAKWYLSKPRMYRYGTIRIKVLPGVFHPGLFNSSRILLDFIRELDLSERTLLELGAGSGIISILAAQKGARVMATDIHPLAIRNIRENAELNQVSLDVILSDLFDDIPFQAWDTIVINPPYYPKDPKNFSQMAWFCGESFGYFKKLFRQLVPIANPSSDIFMILSQDCNLRSIGEIANKSGFQLVPERKQKRLGEWSTIYKIIRVSSPT